MKKIKLHPRRLQAFFKIPIDNEVDAAKTLESIIEETDEESSGQVEQVDGKEIILLKKALDYARTIVLLYPERKLQSMKILPKMDTTTKLLAWTRLVVMEHYSRENTEQWFESIEENVDKVFLEGKTLFKNFLKELKDMTHGGISQGETGRYTLRFFVAPRQVSYLIFSAIPVSGYILYHPIKTMKTSHIVSLNIFITLLLLGGFYYAINTYGTQFLTGAWDKNGVTKVINQKVIQENINEYRKLSDLQSDLTKAILTVQPSVVHIAKKDNVQYNASGVISRISTEGTAIVITSDGYLLTNKHVVNNLRDNYLAISTDGAISSIEHIWVDPVLDLAVLAIASGNQNTTEKLIVASFVSADSPLSLGQFAIAIGSSQDSLNLIQKSSTISQKNRTFAVTTGDSSINIPYFTIDSVVYPGFSGGPTIDLLGNVIGMTTAIEQGARQGTLVLPLSKELVQGLLHSIDQHDKIVRNTFGATLLPLNTYRAQTLGLKKFAGRYVQRVLSGTNAASMGLMNNDIITQINGKEIGSDIPFPQYRLGYGSGDSIEFTVYRDDTIKKLSLTVK